MIFERIDEGKPKGIRCIIRKDFNVETGEMSGKIYGKGRVTRNNIKEQNN